DVEVIGDEAGPSGTEGAGIFVESGTGTTIENNIIVAKSGTDYVALETASGITVTTNYNTYFKNGNTNLVDYNGSTYANLATWSGNGAGADEKEDDPLFVNSGTDYHIQSTYDSYAGGSWPPDLAINGAWTTDGSLSPAIDAGDPTDDYPNEPQSGNIINQGAYGNTAQASKSIVTALTWNGGSNDWQTATNWTPNYVPRSSNNLTIPASLANYPVIDDGTNTAVCFDIDIASGASVTIAPDGQMTVYGDITNSQGVDGLVIQSDATSDGSLIQNTTNIDATVQRFVPTSGSAKWHFISPAVTNLAASFFSNIYKYDETLDDWWTGSSYFYSTTSGWTNPSSSLLSANGYIVYSDQTTFNLTGKLHANSSYSVNVTNAANTGDAANGDAYITFDGWVLVGNPYSCQIDWEIVDKSNDVTSTIYYYDSDIQNYAYYQDGGTTLNSGSRYIPMMQGFFVKSNDIVDGGVFTIPNYARTHESQDFWKAPKQDNLLKISVTDNNLSDETIIKFVDNIKDDFDTQYDAFKQFSWNNNTPQIFTLNSNKNYKYAINALNSSDKTRVIPFGYKFATTGIKTIKITENSLNSVFITIHNNETDEYFQLLDSNSYSFEITDELNTEKLELILEENIAPYFTTQIPDLDEYIETDFVYELPEDLFLDDNKFDNISINVTLSDGSKLPDWLNFNSKALAFSGNSDRADNYSIKVEISDSFGEKSSTNFIMSFKPKAIVYANTKIYPVPAKDLLNVEIAGERTNYHIELVSITGKVLFSKDIEERNSNIISLSNFTNGIYIIKIRFEDRDDYIQKITIMK
ncbi:MAG: T9SS type A sorting domain-containing protein, partial [Bacteroidota bacterium]|nr:T9SS type A sorting domain-containing protein [Bacteroidota bacterium]